MSALIRQLSSVVLPVNVDESGRQFLELSRADRNAADSAGAFPIRADAPLQNKLIFYVDLKKKKKALRFLREVKRCRYNGTFSPSSYHFTADAVSQ